MSPPGLAPAQEAGDPSGSARGLLYLEGELKVGGWNGRIHAVSQLEDYGLKGMPGLTYAMGDADWQVRFTAVHLLGRIGAPALPALRRVLEREPCRVVRITAVHWLGSIGRESLTALREGEKDESGVLRIYDRYWQRKLEGGRKPGSDAKELMEQAKYEAIDFCDNREEPARMGEEEGVRAAEERPPSPPPPEPGAKRVFISEGEDRYVALDFLKSEEPETLADETGIPKSRATSVKAEAGTEKVERKKLEAALGEKIYGAPETLPGPETIPARRAPGEGEGRAIAAAPAGRPAYDPLPALLQALKSGDRGTRFRAADELGQLGPGAKPAVPELSAAVDDASSAVRSSAALALGNIGPGAGAAVPVLVRALDDKNLDVRSSAALALGRMGTPEARKAFSKYLRREAQLIIDRQEALGSR